MEKVFILDDSDLTAFLELIAEDLEEEIYDDDYDFNDEEITYRRYNGSYAQDIEGWSDDDIDIVFEGDPDAYWNID